MGKKSKQGNGAPRGGEVLLDAMEDEGKSRAWKLDDESADKGKKKKKKSDKPGYVDELVKLQFELIKLQDWVQKEGLKVVIIFEGRDAAGKGGVIKRITESLNPRVCRIVALGTPTERERGQWYFQRYVAQLPAKGEIVLFDRSWYNRAGVERVMGFCTDDEYWEFLRACPLFEEMLIRSGIILLKYWFSVSDEVQEQRFRERIDNPIKRWKLSPMGLKSRERWVDYSRAKDVMQQYTDTELSPWHVVNADNKKKARLNCITHILSQIPYREIEPAKIELSPRQRDDSYVRPPKDSQRWVPAVDQDKPLALAKSSPKLPLTGGPAELERVVRRQLNLFRMLLILLGCLIRPNPEARAQQASLFDRLRMRDEGATSLRLILRGSGFA